PIDSLKNISDRQFKANSVTLNEIFLEAITYPIEYEEFILNDVIENEYFEIDSIKQISSSYGNVQLEYEGSPKITWDLSNLATGAKEQLTIEIELNDTYMNNIGVYPTNKEESVYYKIGNVEETISSTQTPILSSHYEVSYDANLPDGCVIEDIPSTTIEQVYDKVTISETNPSCEGYRFDGWKIATESTWQMNEDCFLMPEHNVLLRAEWSKLSIKKSMEGDIFVVYPPILQNTSGGYQGEFWQYKEQITKVIFQNEVRPLNNTKETFDVSEKRNGSVLARLVANEENLDTYTVYIQGEGGVIANRNLNNMFDGFANLVSVEGFENLDTSNTINMDGVFANCQSLKSVDLSSLNVSNVTILKY
ncbi:MAG: BspA family leucine-rich repeat surface protein, partial [Bacilli bacterium]|nr:BspA family leucine-rich repeat surface protein [Bacilli bacterium]